MKNFVRTLFSGMIALISCGCVWFAEKLPPPVEDFDAQKYTGKWYEIARLPAPFEKGMTDVSAFYVLKGNTFFVENTGWKNGKFKTVQGKAHFIRKTDIGLLSVSFFRPFSGEYRIIYLEKDYSAAIVCSGKKYLWILSRMEKLPSGKLRTYLDFIRKAGFNTEKIIWRK